MIRTERAAHGESTESAGRESWCLRNLPAAFGVVVSGAGLIVWMLVAPRIHGGCTDWVPTAWVPWTGAGLIAHGWLGSFYRGLPGIPEFPLWPIVLAPFWALSKGLHLSGSFVHYTEIPACGFSSSLDVYGPVSVAGCSVLSFASDRLSRTLEVTWGKRLFLGGAIGALSWYVNIYNGHPEDVIALGFALWALQAGWDGRERKAGWLFGIALVTQPLVLPLLPIVAVVAGSPRWKGLAGRAVFLPVVMIAPSFLVSPEATWIDVVQQPIIPLHLHQGPLVKAEIHLRTLPAFGTPLRALTLVAGFGGAVWLARRMRSSAELTNVLVVAALVLSMRDIIEGTVNEYYIVPALVCALLAASAAGTRRLGATSALVLGALLVEPVSLPWEVWWIPVMVASWGAIACAAPWRRWDERRDVMTGDGNEEPRSAIAPSWSGPATDSPACLGRVELVAGTAIILAVLASAVYSSSSRTSEDTFVKEGWFHAVSAAHVQADFAPDPVSPWDDAFVLANGKWSQISTLAPPTTISPALIARLSRWRAAANAAVDRFLHIAWGLPPGSAVPSHAFAAGWILPFGDGTSPYQSAWADGPTSCANPPAPSVGVLGPVYGAPDFRILLWVGGCGSSSVWADSSPGFNVVSVTVATGVEPSSILETDATASRLVSAFVPYVVSAQMKVNYSSGGRAAAATPGALGAMTAELRMRGGSLKVWNPWYSDHLTLMGQVAPGTIPGAIPGFHLSRSGQN